MNEVDMAARLSLVEYKIEQWNNQCSLDRADTKADIKALDSKIDELITFKSKGVGAFWLASGLFGGSIFAFVSLIINWIK